MDSTQTLTLTDFLLARIADTERAWDVSEFRARLDPLGDGGMSMADRAVAECEAKRRIVELHTHALRPVEVVGTHSGGEPFVDAYEVAKCSTCGTVTRGEPACPTLRALALPHADHPDYRPEWRP